MVDVKTYKIGTFHGREFLSDDFLPRKKKTLKKIARIAEKYELDVNIFEFYCIRDIIDNIANAYVDDGVGGSIENYYNKAFTIFNQEFTDEEILKDYSDFLKRELEDVNKNLKRL